MELRRTGPRAAAMLALARPAAASFSMSAVELFPSDDLVFFFQARAARRRDRDGRALSLSRSLTISRALSLSRPPRARARDPPKLSPPPRSRARSPSTSRPPRRLSRRASSREQHLSTVRGSRRLLLPDGAHVLRVRQDDLRAVELHARPQGRRAARISRRIAPLTNDAHQKRARARRRSPGQDSTGRQAYARRARAEPARARALF